MVAAIPPGSVAFPGPCRPGLWCAAGWCGRLVRQDLSAHCGPTWLARPLHADRRHAMPVLDQLISAIRSARVEVIDLTSRLDSTTPVIRLPEPFGNTKSFALHEISRYDERGPAWYWNDITTGEHTGTHFDAPVHWATGRDGEDVSQVPVTSLIAPAVVLDFSAAGRRRPGLPARDRACQEVGGRARRAARRRLAALPDRLGRPVAQPAGVPQRQRDRPAHAGDLGPVRAVAGERHPAARARGGDRRHGRRYRALVRPAVPLPRLRCSAPASTASPSCRTWPGSRPPGRW